MTPRATASLSRLCSGIQRFSGENFYMNSSQPLFVLGVVITTKHISGAVRQQFKSTVPECSHCTNGVCVWLGKAPGGELPLIWALGLEYKPLHSGAILGKSLDLSVFSRFYAKRKNQNNFSFLLRIL